MFGQMGRPLFPLAHDAPHGIVEQVFHHLVREVVIVSAGGHVRIEVLGECKRRLLAQLPFVEVGRGEHVIADWTRLLPLLLLDQVLQQLAQLAMGEGICYVTIALKTHDLLICPEELVMQDVHLPRGGFQQVVVGNLFGHRLHRKLTRD